MRARRGGRPGSAQERSFSPPQEGDDISFLTIRRERRQYRQEILVAPIALLEGRSRPDLPAGLHVHQDEDVCQEALFIVLRVRSR